MIRRTKEMREFAANVIEILQDIEYLLEQPSKMPEEQKLAIIEVLFQRFLESVKEKEPKEVTCGVAMP